MLLTKRFFVLVVVGAGLLAGGILFFPEMKFTQALGLLGGYNLALMVALLLDRYLTPGPLWVEITRKYEHRLSLGAANPVWLVINNRSKLELSLVVKDEPPVHFKASARELRVRVGTGQQEILRYTVEPDRRGDYSFGQVNFRYGSVLGLFLYQGSTPGENREFRVYPNIMEIKKYQLLSRHSQLLEAGLNRTRLAGAGTEFESIRDYQVDDEYKRINWSATGRRGRLTTNQYQLDKSQNILLVVDTGRMMAGEVKGLTKLDHAINASLLLGYVAVEKDDNVGLIAFNREVQSYLPPRRGNPQLQKVLAGLYNLQPQIVESDYATLCQYIATKNRKRSLICIFTDLVDEEASKQLITYVSTLTSKHLVVCVTLADSLIVGKAKQLPSDSQGVYEKGVAQGLLAQRAQAVALMKNHGVVVVDVPPEDLSLAVINKYLELKSQLRL